MTDLPRDATTELVRGEVRNVLTRSPAYRALDAEQRRSLAGDMVKVARYIVDAGGETAGTPVRAVVATGLEGADDVSRATKDETAGERFKRGGGEATKQGVDQLTRAVREVNFPQFVAGLVDGVFNAIVSSSIKQMEAYGTLVANVAKSVDEYMHDNITENQARDNLASRYPDHLKVDTAAKGGPKLVPKSTRTGGRGGGGSAGGGRAGSFALADSPAGGLPDFMKDLGLPQPVTRLDAKTAEEKLVPAARRRMAMDRQQLLATMILMGINRLIVTDGKISASCLFQVDTTSAATEDSTSAASFDKTSTDNSWSLHWFAPSGIGFGNNSTTSHFNVNTTHDTSSTEEILMHTELGGNVEINFKSETFPLDRMADLIQIKEIQDKAPAVPPAPAPAAPGFQLPPPPPLPAFPGQQPAGGAPAGA